MTVKFKLGDKVKISDYLVRVQSLTSGEVLKLADAWPELPSEIFDSAKQENAKLGGIKRTLFSNFYHLETHYNIWVPASIQLTSYNELGFWMSEDSRHHPNPSYELFEFPLNGIVTQQYQIQDGVIDNGDEYSGRHLVMYSNTVGYKIAYHLNRRPVLVLPYMMEKI